MINSDADILKDWPASFVARQVEAFCCRNEVIADYGDQRQMLTAMAKHCHVTPLKEPKQLPVRQVVRVHAAASNVLNCNVPVHVTEHIIEVICNGKA